MKMKKVKEVCKRIGMGLLSAALLLTGGSFSQVRSAKAANSDMRYFYFNISSSPSSYNYTGSYPSDVDFNSKVTGFSSFDYYMNEPFINCRIVEKDVSKGPDGDLHIPYYEVQAEVDGDHGVEILSARLKSIFETGKDLSGNYLFHSDEAMQVRITDDKCKRVSDISSYFKKTTGSSFRQYVNFYTYWWAPAYDIQFDATGEDPYPYITNLPDTISTSYGENVVLPDFNPMLSTGEDVKLVGYSTVNKRNENYTDDDITYKPGETVKNLIKGSEMVVHLYPVWKSRNPSYNYTVTVKDMCGDTELGSKQIANGIRKYNEASQSYSGSAAGTKKRFVSGI